MAQHSVNVMLTFLDKGGITDVGVSLLKRNSGWINKKQCTGRLSSRWDPGQGVGWAGGRFFQSLYVFILF